MSVEIASKPLRSNDSGMRGTAGARTFEKCLSAFDRHASIVLEGRDDSVDHLSKREISTDAEERLQLGNEMASAMNRFRDLVDRYRDFRASLGMLLRLVFVGLSGHVVLLNCCDITTFG